MLLPLSAFASASHVVLDLSLQIHSDGTECGGRFQQPSIYYTNSGRRRVDVGSDGWAR